MSDIAQTPEAIQLHDAAISAVEAWQTNPTDETKKAAAEAVAKAKEGLKSYVPEGYIKKPSAPEKYEVTLPEGSKFDKAHLEKIYAYAREKGFSNDDVQGLLKRDQELYASYEASKQEEVNKAREGWAESSKSDKEFGGAEFDKNVELAKRVISRYGSDDLSKALNETGLGNHPELLRLLVRVGKGMTEDQLIIGSGERTPEKKDPASILYPSNV